MAKFGKFMGSMSITKMNNPMAANLSSSAHRGVGAKDIIKQPSAKLVHRLALPTSHVLFNNIGRDVLEPISITKGFTPYSEKAKPISTAITSFKAVWPFDFFQSELTIESGRIILHERNFFFADTVSTMLVANIASCEVSKSVYFAEIKVNSKFGDQIVLRWLRREDAIKAKEIIDELMWQEKAGSVQQSDDSWITASLLHLLHEAHECTTIPAQQHKLTS